MEARSLIRRQSDGDADLSLEKAPLLLWEQFLRAEGTKRRKIDELAWEPLDFASDGVHLGESGRQKVAHLLPDFFAGDPMASAWLAVKSRN